jgi:hypothetical protein
MLEILIGGVLLITSLWIIYKSLRDGFVHGKCSGCSGCAAGKKGNCSM